MIVADFGLSNYWRPNSDRYQPKRRGGDEVYNGEDCRLVDDFHDLGTLFGGGLSKEAGS